MFTYRTESWLYVKHMPHFRRKLGFKPHVSYRETFEPKKYFIALA